MDFIVVYANFNVVLFKFQPKPDWHEIFGNSVKLQLLALSVNGTDKPCKIAAISNNVDFFLFILRCTYAKWDSTHPIQNFYISIRHHSMLNVSCHVKCDLYWIYRGQNLRTSYGFDTPQLSSNLFMCGSSPRRFDLVKTIHISGKSNANLKV